MDATSECIDNGAYGEVVVQAAATPGSMADDVMNILVLGPAGVGKSTFINAFLNYLSYSTIEEALDGGIKVAIPARFAQFNRNTAKHDDFETGDNSAGEESFSDGGGSSTLYTKSHLFPLEYLDGHKSTLYKFIRIVDTPGIGDTRGIEEDKKNFEDILSNLSSLTYLHGICILLKPNEARLNVYIEYCMTELVAHLHRNATQNLVFCFTNTLQTNYSVGETIKPLREILRRLKDRSGIVIELNFSTMFCFENEGFRYLITQQNSPGYHSTVEAPTRSWDTSRKEFLRLISHFNSLTPHAVAESISLQKVKTVLENLEEAVGFIISNIDDNMRRIEKHRRKIQERASSIEELKKNLTFKRKVIEIKPLEHSRNVCTSDRCIDYVDTEDGKQIIFSTICHERCSLSETRDVDSQRSNSCPGLGFKKWLCSSINLFGQCKRCGCHFERHVFITYEVESVDVEETNEEVAKSIADGESASAVATKLLQAADTSVRQLRNEKGIIDSVALRVAIFLRMSSITPTNEYRLKYWQAQVRLKETMAHTEEEYEEVERMKASMKDHQRKIQSLTDRLKTGHDSNEVSLAEITLPRIWADVEMLYDLEFSGPSFRQAQSAVRRTTQHRIMEAVHELPPEHGFTLARALKKLFTSSRN